MTGTLYLICKALGWSRGTLHDAVNAIEQQRALNAEMADALQALADLTTPDITAITALDEQLAHCNKLDAALATARRLIDTARTPITATQPPQDYSLLSTAPGNAGPLILQVFAAAFADVLDFSDIGRAGACDGQAHWAEFRHRPSGRVYYLAISPESQ